MLDLVGRDAGDDVVAVGEEETDEADLEWREGRGYEPGPGRVVGCLERVSLHAHTRMGHHHGPGYGRARRAVGGWPLRNEGPGADWVCLDGPDSEAFRSAMAMSESYGD